MANEETTYDVLVLGIGNILWADEGFGPRVCEAFHRAYATPEKVLVADGGTLGMYLTGLIMSSRRLIVVDCCDFKEAPGYMRVLREDEIRIWSSTKISPHQTGFNDLLASCMLMGHELEKITVIGVQPNELDDFGGGLTALLQGKLPEAVSLVKKELEDWGYPVRERAPDEEVEPLMADCVEEFRYENERPGPEEACRDGDERFMVREKGVAVDDPDIPPMRS